MSWRPNLAAQNKQAKPNRSDQAAAFISEIIGRQPEDSQETFTFSIGRRPEGTLSGPYLQQAGETTTQRLGDLGMHGWQVDLEASEAASKVPNPWGYGNQSVKIWNENGLSLVVRPAVAEIIPLPVSVAEVAQAIAA